jgi:hypothetical protein
MPFRHETTPGRGGFPASPLPAAFLGLALLLVAAIPRGVAGGAPARHSHDAARLEFNRDIRPILSANCSRCHGPDKNQRQADLRLDVRDVAVEKGAIVPGKPDESELVRRIFAPSPDEVMPPPGSRKSLSEREKETLREWIAQGAEYQAHWAHIVPARPPVPAVRRGEWVRNPIDAFILGALEARGLAPSPGADARTLARRLHLDLIGLPPEPDEVESFLADRGDAAHERRVETLLASPHYGERMAAPWLDAVRFADTVGYHGDQNQNIFPYRDYVIDSFNSNKPFDRFTVEQIAGDLLEGGGAEALVATGLNRLNMMTREGGAQPAEYLAKYAADRVRTVGTAWLGSTLGCAECHDHKFDPFTTRDFYRLAAFFADVKQWGVYQDYGYTPNPDLRGFSNDHPFPPELEVKSPYLERRIARLEARLDEICSDLGPEPDEWRRESVTFLENHPDGWARLQAPVAGPAGGSTPASDGSVLLSGKPDQKTELRLRLGEGWLAAIRLEALPDEKHGGSIVRGGGRVAAVTLSAGVKRAGDGAETRIEIFHADADRKEERYSNGHAVLGVKDVWRTSAEHRKSPQSAVWLPATPARVKEGDTLVISLGGALGRVRISVSPFAGIEPLGSGGGEPLLAVLRKPPAERTEAESALAARTRLLGSHAGPDAAALGKARKLQRDIFECRGGRARTLVTESREPLPTRVLPRGNWQDQTGELVEPGTPAFLEGPRSEAGRRLTRLDLARWLVSRENPLTARALVNRLWKQFFGTGLSAVLDDLGAQGEWPSHPELLDWLAVELMESGWDVKHMVRLMVTSSTYRQDSRPRQELVDIDPTNRLLAAQSPRRLEAEIVRDNALAIAGLLDREIGGPSAFPYQPAGYYVNLQFPDRDYHPSGDERQYRRGVYTHWQRTFLHPMLANFDAPSREECTAIRPASNTPQQALTLLNDPTFVEAARVLAERILASGVETDEERLDLAFRRALARPVIEKERDSLLRFLAREREHFREHPEEPRLLARVGNAPASFEPATVSGSGAAPAPDGVELAAWTSACRVILNLHETITRY